MATTSYGTPYVEAADLVSGYPGTSLSLADRVDDISFKGNGINNQTGTTYTLDILDAGKTVTLSNSSAVTVTIPTNTAEAIEVGSVIRFNNKGSGTVTIQPDGGVTLNGGNLSLAQNAAAQIVKLDTNTWGAIDSIGTPSGLTLISPSSIANSGGSASATGGAVTFTTVNSVSLNGVFTSTYENYRIVVNYSIGADTDMNFRLRASGTDATGSDYTTIISDNSGSVTVSRLTSQTTTRVGAARNGIQMRASGDIFSPQLSAVTSMSFRTVSSAVDNMIGGTHGLSSAYDGFTIYPASSTASGTIRVYGYRN